MGEGARLCQQMQVLRDPLSACPPQGSEFSAEQRDLGKSWVVSLPDSELNGGSSDKRNMENEIEAEIMGVYRGFGCWS